VASGGGTAMPSFWLGGNIFLFRIFVFSHCICSSPLSFAPRHLLLYPNFGPKNTYSKYFSISDECLWPLRDCQFAIVLHWFFYSALSSNFALKILSTVYLSIFSCISSHPKMFLLYSKVIWTCLWSSAYFSAFYFNVICRNS
jgi:hypothetical protein